MDMYEYTKSYIKTLTKDEVYALRRYTENRFRDINDDLRSISDFIELIRPEEYKLIKHIDSALDKYTYFEPIRVYRKLRIDYHKEKFIELCKRGFILDKAFQSTSLREHSYLGCYNILMDIDINSPNHGALISPVSYYMTEQEFLLKRDTRLDIDEMKEERSCCYIKCHIK